MSKKVILNWSPPAPVNVPSPAHSILKAWLEQHAYSVSVLYWNLYFFTLQRDFVFQNQKAYNETFEMLLFLNYIAIRDNNKEIYNEVRNILQGINPKYITLDPDFYNQHMVSAYQQMDKIIDELFSSINFAEVLAWGFSMKMEQWLFASIIAKKIKSIYPTTPIIIGGINTKDTALAYLNNFVQFDYAIWGEGETPLLELIRNIENNSPFVSLQNVSNIAYRNGNSVLASPKHNKQYLDMSNPTLYPNYSDFFRVRKMLNIDCLVQLPIEGSRGCHWNRCRFCYLNTDYKYRMKAIEKVETEIRHSINTYGIFNFQFLDNDLVGKDINRFHFLLDCFLRIKKDFPQFRILLAEIITKDLDHATIKRMSDSCINYTQIGYESISGKLLRKIDKKNTFSSNLLYIKFAIYYNIAIGGVNVITGLQEETTEDIVEACNNIRFLRFFLDYKIFRHTTTPLAVNTSSKYYKKINKNDSVWHLYKLSHVILQNIFNKDDQWKLFEFIRSNENVQWDNFHNIERYYLTNKHTYKIEHTGNDVVYNEYVNNKRIKSLVWNSHALEVEILYITNDKPRSFDELYAELNTSANTTGQSAPEKAMIIASLELLNKEGLIYYDEFEYDDKGDKLLENIISIIVMFRPE